jgi:hypothetical protein
MLARIALTLIGAALGVLCALMSLVVGGAGHGWTAAWPFGLLSLALFPAAFYGVAAYRKSSGVFVPLILGVALVLDIALGLVTFYQGLSYFFRAGVAAWQWIGLWSMWQLAVLATAFLGRTRRADG